MDGLAGIFAASELADPQQLNDPSADSGEDETAERQMRAARLCLWRRPGNRNPAVSIRSGLAERSDISLWRTGMYWQPFANEDPSIMAQAVLEVTNAGDG
ncbi:MAG: hypothetical protein ACLVJO_15120 [[Clostridium] scindens]